MSIRLRDRVKQGTLSTGTGTISFSTSFSSFQDFSGVLSDGDSTYYVIEDGTDFEVGQGTYSGNTLSRDEVFSSSNSNLLLSLVGSNTVFITYPAERSVHLNDSGNVTGIESIDFKLGVTPTYSEGRVFYDNVNHSLAVYNDEADITLQVGQEEYLRVRNRSGSQISNGQAVKIEGSQGTNATVELAIATDFNSSNVIGLATHNIENNSFGYITTFGLVNDIDTSDFTEGSELYLSPILSGGLTGVAPVAPFYQTPIGVCVRSHPSVGTILVQPRSARLGGFDVKNLGNIQNSGVPFISEISESSGAILDTNTGFYYSVSTDTLNAVNLDVAGTVTANSFVGNGSGLTGVPASNPFNQDLNTDDQVAFDQVTTEFLVRKTGGASYYYSSGEVGDVDTSFIAISGNKIEWERTGSTAFPTDLTFGIQGVAKPKVVFDGVNGTITFKTNGADRLKLNNTGQANFAAGIKFVSDNTYGIGSNTQRASTIHSNFSNFNNINIQSGQFQFIKSGTTIDGEWFDFKFANLNNQWEMRPKKAGSGNFQDFTILASKFQNTYIKYVSGGSTLALGYGDDSDPNNHSLLLTSNQVRFGKTTLPTSNGIANGMTLGSNSLRFPKFYATSGDFFHGKFEANLGVAESGVFKIYASGNDGDVNTRYFQAAGIGSGIFLGSYKTGPSGRIASDLYLQHDELNRIAITPDSVVAYIDVVPSLDSVWGLGKTDARFSNVISVSGDFSDDLTVGGDVVIAGDLILTGIPYSDPSNSGQVWQSGTYLQISLGPVAPPP